MINHPISQCIYPALLLVVTFLSVTAAKSIFPQHYRHGTTSMPPAGPLYMNHLSMYLGYTIERLEQHLRYYDRCYRDSVHPNGQPIEDYWQCEQAWFPDHMLKNQLAETRYYLEYYPSLGSPSPRDLNIHVDESPPSNFVEELAIYRNMNKLIDIVSIMQKFRSWSTNSAVWPDVRDIARLWTGSHSSKVDSWIEYQYLKHHRFYSDFESRVVIRQILDIAGRLERLVLNFKAEPIIWPTLPAEVNHCPSSQLFQWQEEVSGLSQVCYNRWQRGEKGESTEAVEMLYTVPEGPAVFSQFAKPCQRAYDCCCEQADRWRGVDIEAQRIRERFLNSLLE